jgi:hypothetical protein
VMPTRIICLAHGRAAAETGRRGEVLQQSDRTEAGSG